MKKFKTEKVSIIVKIRDDGINKQILVRFWEEPQQELFQTQIIVPTKLCKQNFTDASITKHLLNFFIKE